MLNRNQSLRLISTLSDANGPSGFEDEVTAAARAEMEELSVVSEDALRNLYLSRRENTGDRPVIMLDAHSDEVGFMIRQILPNGMMRFLPLGGWSNYTIPASKVRIRTLEGNWISGVVATKPVHYMSASEKGKTPEIADMVIDAGVSSYEEAVSTFSVFIIRRILTNFFGFYFTSVTPSGRTMVEKTLSSFSSCLISIIPYFVGILPSA